MKTCTLDGNNFIIKFSGDNFIQTLNIVKSLYNREYINEKRYWIAQATIENYLLLRDNGFEIIIPKDNKSDLFNVNNLPSIIKNIDYSQLVDQKKLKGLFPYQKEAIYFIESLRPNIKQYWGIIGDECGIGKTIETLGLCKLHLSEGSFIIICTASMKLKWAREIKKWTNEDSYICYGEKETTLPKSKFYIINYHILGRENIKDKKKNAKLKLLHNKNEELRKLQCKKDNLPYKKKKYKDIPIRLEGWFKELSKINAIGIFPDEAHRLANKKAIWTKCFLQLMVNVNPKIFVPLSGTIIRKSSKNFWVLLHLLSPTIFNNEYRYLYKFCEPKHNGFGWTFDGNSNEQILHELLKPIMIRRLKDDVLDLPPKVFNVIPMELDKLEERNYLDATKELKLLLKEKKVNNIAIENNISKIKRLAYLAKRNSLFVWLDEYLEDHNKLVITTWHKSVIEDLFVRYKKISVKIDGSVNSKDRQLAEDRFQNDPKVRFIFIQTDAGGEGLTLTSSDSIAIIEIPSTPGQLVQLVGRIDRVGQKAKQLTIYFPFANGTIENDIADNIEQSYQSVSKILDGKETNKIFTDYDKLIIKKIVESI